MEKLSCSEREKLLQAARTLAPTIREKFKVQRKEIEARCEEDVKKRAVSQLKANLLQLVGENATDDVFPVSAQSSGQTPPIEDFMQYPDLLPSSV